MQDLRAGGGQGNEHQDDRQGDDHGPTEDLIDGGVDDPLKGLLSTSPQILSDPVKDDDRIREEVARQGEQRGHYEQRDLLVQGEEDAKHRQDIVQRRHGGGHTKAQVKPYGNRDHNPHHRDGDGNQRVLLQLLPHGRPDFHAGFHDKGRPRKCCSYRLEDSLGHLVFQGGLGLEPDQQLVFRDEVLEFNVGPPMFR